MAQTDGFEFVETLRKFDREVPVIVSSGHCTPEQMRTLKALGVQTFLDKPYTTPRLLHAVNDELKRARAQVAPIASSEAAGS